MKPLLSSRARWSAPLNRLTAARHARREEGLPELDLTISNPTHAGLDYAREVVSDILASAATAKYDPDPRGLRTAREALARSLSKNGRHVEPDDLLLTASTTEAYAFLFKLLADSGDSIITARPSYPLLEHITALENVKLESFALHHNGGANVRRKWTLDAGDLARQLTERTRAVVVVHPNNPTGHYLTADEQETIGALCSSRNIALVSDEVFFDYAIAPPEQCAPPAAQLQSGLTISLGGLSKSAALPHWKLGWIHLGGDPKSKALAAEGLELIADTFLSVATPVQVALERILDIAPGMRATILARLKQNLRALRSAIATVPALEVLEPEGGWSVVVRVPRLSDDETLALELLDQAGVVVQPGYFFDFESDGFVVLSLLTPPADFEEGVAKIADYFVARLSS